MAPSTSCRAARMLARQRFTHHVHERQIPGEEGRATVSAKYRLQATERFARAWNAGDKDDFMLPGSRGLIYRSADCVGGAREIADIRASLCNLCDAVPRV